MLNRVIMVDMCVLFVIFKGMLLKFQHFFECEWYSYVFPVYGVREVSIYISSLLSCF